MSNFAVMSGTLVTNVIVTDDKEATEQALNCVLIEYTADNPASIGWLYDEATKTFIAPAPPEPEISEQE